MKWIDEIIRPKTFQDLMSDKKVKPLPMAVTGVYFLIKNNEVVYVGQSTNVLNRIQGHKDKDYDQAFYIECEKDSLLELETKYIIAFTPKMNKTLLSEIHMNYHRLFCRCPSYRTDEAAEKYGYKNKQELIPDFKSYQKKRK